MTKEQKKEVSSLLMQLFEHVILDLRDREAFVNRILRPVIRDIDETADWSELDDDEICHDDVCIAVRRVLFKKFHLDV